MKFKILIFYTGLALACSKREFLNAIDVLEEEIEQVQGNLPNH